MYIRLLFAIRCLLLSILALGLLSCSTSSASSSAGSSNHAVSRGGTDGYPAEYDPYLRYSSERFLPQYEWRWLKAQCFQESLLNPRAVSSAGAMGLCQFMPGTWNEVSTRLNLNASVFNPKANSIAAGYYMGRLVRQWTVRRSDIERLKLGQASYNAGLGSILRAQKKCNNAVLWKDIFPCLGYQETKDYVRLIAKHYNTMEGNRQ